MLEDDAQVGFGDQEKVVGDISFRRRIRCGVSGGLCIAIRGAQQAHGAHLDLALGFFAGNIQHAGIAGHYQRNLQQQRRFTNSRVAADEDDGAGHNAAAQDAGKFANCHRLALFAIIADLGQASRA